MKFLSLHCSKTKIADIKYLWLMLVTAIKKQAMK